MVKKGERVEVASRFVTKVNRLLDVGCGPGRITPFIKGKVKKVYGIDNSTSALKEAKKKGVITKLIDLNSQPLPYPNDFFDIITCLDVVEHIKDPIVLFNKIKEKIKLGGVLIVSAPNIRFSDHLFRLIVKGRFPVTSTDKNDFDGGHIHYFTFSDIKEILQKLDFKIVREKGIINKASRGIKGKILTFLFGEKLMREFRSPGLLIVARKMK